MHIYAFQAPSTCLINEKSVLIWHFYKNHSLVRPNKFHFFTNREYPADIGKFDVKNIEFPHLTFRDTMYVQVNETADFEYRESGAHFLFLKVCTYDWYRQDVKNRLEFRRKVLKAMRNTPINLELSWLMKNKVVSNEECMNYSKLIINSNSYIDTCVA